MAPEGDGYDRLSKRTQSYGERQAGNLADRPVWTVIKWLLGITAVFVVLGLGGCALGFIGSWGNEAKRVASPKNVRKQYALVIGDWKNGVQAADNACQAGADGSPPVAGDPNDPQIVESPGLAYAGNYRSIIADYDAAQDDIFRAKAVGPKGYPRHWPVYPEAEGKTPNFCGVAGKLRQVHP